MKIKEAYDEYLGNIDGQVEIKHNYKELIEEKNKEVEGHRRNLEREKSLGIEKRAVISTLQDEVNDLKLKLVDRDSQNRSLSGKINSIRKELLQKPMLISMGTQTDIEKHISDSPAMAHSSTILIKKSDMSLSLSDHSKFKPLES